MGEAILSNAVTIRLLWPPFRKPCLHLLPALAFGAKRLAKVMHLYENFRRWKHLDQLLISALIKQER
jgi:hypothetical protein